jgi:hypothetical protein
VRSTIMFSEVGEHITLYLLIMLTMQLILSPPLQEQQRGMNHWRVPVQDSRILRFLIEMFSKQLVELPNQVSSEPKDLHFKRCMKIDI